MIVSGEDRANECVIEERTQVIPGSLALLMWRWDLHFTGKKYELAMMNLKGVLMVKQNNGSIKDEKVQTKYNFK